MFIWYRLLCKRPVFIPYVEKGSTMNIIGLNS